MVVNIPNAQNRWGEVQAARKYWELRSASMSERIRRYAGPGYWGPARNEKYDPENHEFEHISLIGPKVVFDNPRVRCSTIRLDSMTEVAAAMQSGLNRWIKTSRLRKTLDKIHVDMEFCWGIGYVTLEKAKRQDLPPEVLQRMDPDVAAEVMNGGLRRPKAMRVSPRMWFADPLALDDQQFRYTGHWYITTKDKLLQRAGEEDGWIVEEIESLPEDQKSSLDEKSKQAVGVPARKDVRVYEIWYPDITLDGAPTPDEGYNGTIFTMGENGHDIRAPRPYYGPEAGPYVLFGQYVVPDEAAPLSSTAAVSTQVDVLNMHARAVAQAASRRKRFIVTNDSSTDLAAKVKRCKDGDVLSLNVADLNNNMKEVEVGGITDSALAGLNMERERRDRISGLSNAMRGAVTGSATATENSIADEASSLRVAYIRQQFQDGVIELLNRVAWYFYYENRIVFPIETPQGIAAPTGQQPWFNGGFHQQGSGASFEDLDLDIEPYSMERTSESLQQKRLMELVTLVTQVLPAALMSPVNLPELMNLVGNFGNVPEFAKIVQMDIAKQIQAKNLLMMLMPAQPQPAGPEQGQPRLGTDVGVSPIGGSPPKIAPSVPRGTSSGMKASDRLNPVGSNGLTSATR